MSSVRRAFRAHRTATGSRAAPKASQLAILPCPTPRPSAIALNVRGAADRCAVWHPSTSVAGRQSRAKLVAVPRERPTLSAAGSLCPAAPPVRRWLPETRELLLAASKRARLEWWSRCLMAWAHATALSPPARWPKETAMRQASMWADRLRLPFILRTNPTASYTADNRSVHVARRERAKHRERSMRTIAIIDAKGGSGTSGTTFALHLAVCGRSGWSQRRRDRPRPAVDGRELELSAQLASAGGTGSRSQPARRRTGAGRRRRGGRGVDRRAASVGWRRHRGAASPRVADLLVVPVRPSIVDLEATVAVIERLRSVTAAPVMLRPWPRCRRRRGSTHRPWLEVCPVRIGQRLAFARSLATCRSGSRRKSTRSRPRGRNPALARCARYAQRGTPGGKAMSKFTDT